jgi:hypothetical protein
LYGAACGGDGPSGGAAGGVAAGGPGAAGAGAGAAGAAGAAGGVAAGGGGGAGRPPEFASSLVARLGGTEGYDWAGHSLLAAGDLNGDGVADAAVSSLSAGSGGRVAVFFGPLRGERATTAPDALLTGEFPFHNAGQSIAEAGPCDFDGDGNADLLIGSPFGDRYDVETQATGSGDNAGRAYIVFGGPAFAPAWAPQFGARLARADVTFVGERAYDGAGFTVGCAGDLDGDGRDEAVVGAPRAGASAGGARAGAAYVVYGRARSDFPVVLGLERADAVVRGDAAYDAFGSAVAALGDVTGDGRPDFGVGAPGVDAGAKDAGGAYVFAGGAARLAGELAAGAAGRLLYGAEAGGRAGMALTSAGDFDGDGARDVAVGSSTAGAAERGPGRAYLVPGGGALGAIGRAPLAAAALTLTGATAGDLAGLGVGRVGDLDGDGRDELAVGAPGGDGAEPGAGRVYLVKGRAFSAGASAPLGAERVVALGGGAGDLLGEVVRGGLDLDGDGTPDLMITARGRSAPAATAAGAAYVLSGKGLLP